ncbi:septation ring formation regulator EzrA [Calditerricola satsumensis]|uniref:TPM domain-containing protein n=3 Tax=Calditerricola satsumensis TaxID=373054 RepID=A0A8J3BAF5_9BACI|nr:septation ring formation regulator EzrA [Calditerricola satsumensis]GGK00751.1 hypothetical protein GCM10007043_13490 [Calditerricola satsumensis]
MKRRAVLLALAMVVAFFCLRASAQALPPWQDRPVLDEARLFSAPERQQMEELIRAFPYPVTVVVVPTMNGRAPDDVAREAFAAYGLDPRHLLLVVDAQRGALGVYAGAALAKAGLSAEWLAEKRRIFFEPYEKQNEIATGVAAFLQAVLDDTAQMAAAANLPRAATPAASDPSDRLSWSVVLLVASAVGAASSGTVLAVRQGVRRAVARQRARLAALRGELDAAARAYPASLAGQTASAWAEWCRSQVAWTERTTALEGTLDDIEDAGERFRLVRALRGVRATAQEVLALEEEARRLREASARLREAAERVKVALPHAAEEARVAGEALEAARQETGSSFAALVRLWEEGRRRLDEAERDAAAGDSLAAEAALSEARNAFRRVVTDSDALRLSRTAMDELENALRSAEATYRLLQESGYRFAEWSPEATLAGIHEERTELAEAWEAGDAERVTALLPALREAVERLSAQLEEEQAVRNAVGEQMPAVEARLRRAEEQLAAVEEELDALRHIYCLSEGDVFEAHARLREEAGVIADKLASAARLVAPETQRFRAAHALLADAEQAVDALLREGEDLLKRLEAMRKDERAVRQAVVEMERILHRRVQDLERAFLPLPKGMEASLREARAAIRQLQAQLRSVPLDVDSVRHQADALMKEVRAWEQAVEALLAGYRRAEEAICRANRYRGAHPRWEQALKEAEEAFRSLDFAHAEALAQAVLREAEGRRRPFGRGAAKR